MKLTQKFAALALSLPLAVVCLSWADQTPQPSPDQKTTAATPEATAQEGRKEPAKFLSGKDPDYSETARDKHVEGTVILAVSVNEKGKVTSVKVVNPLESSLDRRAMKAVRHWRFAPAMLDGKPVASEFNVSVDFRLNR